MPLDRVTSFETLRCPACGGDYITLLDLKCFSSCATTRLRFVCEACNNDIELDLESRKGQTYQTWSWAPRAV